MDKKWRETDTLRFIKLYEAEECLWNFKHKNYKNKNARQISIEKIITAMGMPGLKDFEVRNKIRNIRSTYAQELTKFIKAVKAGKTDYASTPIWFPIAHRFLGKVVAAKCLDEGVNDNAPSEREKKIIDAACEERVRVIQETLTNFADNSEDSRQVIDLPNNNWNTVVISRVQSLAASPDINNSLKRKRSEIEVPETVEISKEKEDLPKTVDNNVEDEFFHFAKNVACQLRQLPLKSALLTQTKILDILAKERIAATEKKSTTPTVLPVIVHYPKAATQQNYKNDSGCSAEDFQDVDDEAAENSSDDMF